MSHSFWLVSCILLAVTLHSKGQASNFENVGGVSIHHQYHEGEKNTPLILLEAGARSHSGMWESLIPLLVSQGYSVLSYDRPGLGRSEQTGLSRSGIQIAKELNLLVRQLGIKKDLILIGHSMGGMYAAIYAFEFPSKVKGLIMLDSPNKDWEELLQGCLTEEQRLSRSEGLSAMRQTLTQSSRNEYRDAQESFLFLDKIRLKIPVIIISGGSQHWPDGFDADCLSNNWQTVQKGHLKISNASKQIAVPQSGHAIPNQAPQVILNAIKDLGQRP